VHFNL